MSFVDFDGELDTQPAFEDFSGRLDGESDSLPKRAVQDTAVDLAKGVVGFGESVVGLADLATAGSVGNALQRIGYDPKQTKSFLEGFYTEDRKTANQAVSQADGFMDTLATMGANPSTIIGSIVESLPGTIGAGAVGGAVVRRALSSAFAEAKALGLTGDALTSFMSQKATEIGAQRAAILASSVAEGAQSAGSIAEAGRQAGRDWSEYALPAAAGGAATSLINVGSTKLANKLGIGDIETDIAMRQAGAGKFASSGSFAKRVPLEAVKEGVFEEMPQSWQEQIAQNIAEGRPDIFEGAGKAAAQGLVAGAGMGGGHAALTHSAPRPADILNTPNTQQAIDTFNAAVQADVTADDDINAIGALMQDYTAANRQTLEAAQAQLDAEVDQGDPLAVANPADVTNAAALARTAQADQAIAATLSDEEQGIGIPPAAADTANLPDTSAPITGQRSLAQQVLEISRNGGPRTEAERGLMAMARRDLGEQKVAEIERLGQAPALMTRMEQKDVERGATPPITIVPNDNGVPIIRSQTPEISTAVNVELKAAGINTHTIDGTSIRVPKAQAQVAQQIVSRVNTRFTQPRQEQTLGTQAEETVPTEQGQPESQPAATLTLGNASHAQSATVRAMLGGQMSAEDHVGIIDNLDTLPTQVDANQGPRIGRPMAKTIKMLAEMLGRKVVFYETTNKEVAEGINRDGNTLYVNIDSNVDAVAVAGHEMVHSIEHEQPELYAVMLDATKALLKSGGRQRAVSYAKYAGARNIDSAARELLSDVGGNEWRSGQFWSDVFDEVHRSHAPTEARSIIAKIRDAVVAFINKLIRATPKQGFQHGYTREELAEIRDNLVKATAESFRRAERVRLGLAPTPEAKAGEVRYSRRAGQTNYQYRADQLERAFEQMGLTVYRDSSRVSQSEYVEVESPEYTASEGERGEVLKFRVSDHELPKSYSQPDFDVIADGKIHGGVAWNKSGTWVEAVEWLAGMWKLPVPAVIRQTKERAVTQEKKDQARFKQGAVRYAQERLDVFDAAVAAGKVTGKKTNSGAWSLSGVPYVNLGTFPGESFDLNKAISRAREKLVAEVEARNMDAEGAPTPSVDPDSIGSRSLDTSRNEMQERPAVRADESGSPEEPAQSGGGAGSEAIIAKSNPRVFVEVAPDPNNSALTEAWRSQPYDERVAMSRSVFQKILPNVLSALGIKGEFSEQLGGYKLDTNPSFAALFDNANDAHRFSLLAGYALSQDSMMVLSGQKFDGAMDAGIIEIELPKDFTQGQVHSAYLAARGTWPGKISGHTTKDGIMHIVVPRKTALQVAMKVNKALGNKYPVHYAEGYYAFPQKKDYDYASIQGTSSAQLPGTREDASKLRAEASRLIQSELAKRGVRFSNQRQAPDAASGGLDGRGYAGNARTGISATGIHYSREQRGQLDSSFFGQGLNSEELERVRNSQDSRLRHRIYFYVNGGRGINPEQGVGAHAHQAELHHLYDLESDPRDFGLVADPNERESKILDSGYSGTIAPSRGIAVLIGPRSIPVEYKGYGRPEVAQVKGAEPSAYGKAQRALADRRDLPSGRMKGSEWQKTLPEMDLSHLDTDAYYYKDALLERPRFSKFRQVDTESPEFKRWSDNAEIVPRDSTFTKDFESEKPVVVQVIHGTAGDFTSFEKDRANPESDMGAGFYSTNDELDASANYAGEGPDLKAKLDTMADRIQDEDEFADDRIAAEAEARRRLAVRNQGFAMPVWVRFKKPFVLGGERETVLTYNEPYNEETDGYGEEAGTLVDFIVELRSVTGQFNEGSVESLVDSVLEKARDYGQVGAAELFSVMTEDEKFGYYTDDEGRLVSKEIFRQTLDNLGYDGVIDQTVNEKFGDRRKYGQKMRGVVDGTKHFIAFSPAQIKSAIANTGEFSDTNPDIRYSAPRAQPWYYSQLEQGVRTMPAKVSGTSANNVALWLKSNADKLKIKKEEVEWSGVMDYLASLGKEKVTAEQLADWVAKNGVKVEEVVLGGEAPKRTVYQVWLDGQQISEAASMRRAEMYANMNPGAEVRTVDVDIDTPTTPKHASGNLVLPGGTDHREIVLTVPTIEPYNESDSTHYGDVGNGKQIAWARVNTRIDANGNKVLFVEEIQSQRNQHGRKKGFGARNRKQVLQEMDAILAEMRKRTKEYAPTEEDWANNPELQSKFDALDAEYQSLKESSAVPTAPFVSTKDGKPVDSYIPLVLKRLIAYAVDTGHTAISWTTGEQQADRYSLEKQIRTISWNRDGEADKIVTLSPKNDNDIEFRVLPDGMVTGVSRLSSGTPFDGRHISDVVGKDIGDKILTEKYGELSGDGLKVGGGWTASMYGDPRGLDAKGKPSMIAAAARKLGAEVGEVGVNSGIDTMDEEIRWTEYADGTQHVEWSRGEKDFDTESEAQKFVDSLKNNVQKQPGFTITPAMQEQASKGMPLFSKQRIIGDSGRQYTNEQKDLFKHVGREVDEKTTLEKLKSWIGKNWAQGLFDQFAPVKSLSNHAYTLMRLSKGATGAFEAFMRHGKLSIRDGAYDADTSGGVIDQVFIPLGKETTDFLYWIAGNRAERLVAEDREHLFTQAHIAAAKSLATGDTDFDYTLSNGTVTRKRALIFRDALKKFNDFSKNALDMAEQSGLIDGASRQYWEHEFYVPFYRVADEKDGGIRGMNIKQGVVRQKAFEMLKGGEEKLGDLLSNTLMNWAHLIDASAKNRAAKTTIDAAVNLGAARKAVAGEKNVVWYSDKGRKAEFVVDDPALLVALNGLEYAGLRGPAMDALSATKHWLTMGVTASPFFKVRNLIRDSIQSIAVSDLSYNPLHNVKEGWKLTNRASQEYVSALAGGGLIRFGTMLEGSEAARTRQLIKQGSKDSHILDGEGKLQAFYDKVIEPAWSKYQELGNRGEEINRMALYDKLIAEGKTHAEAALAARDLMDFSMSGAFTSVRFLTQVVPFLNARLQGLYKLGKGAKEDKARFAIVMAATALAGLAMMGYASGDDDRWKRWKKREQWDKDNYWMFSFGDVDYRIPKPFEIGAMATLVERGFETAFMLGDEKNKWSKFGQAVLKIAGDQLSMNPVPQLAKPILDIYANKDSFSGRPIETMSMERLKKDYRFSASTSMLARGASTAGNAVASVAGMEFLSPVQIDHLVRSYFGWVGTASVASADFMLRPMTNEPSRPEKDMLKWMSGGMVTDKDSAGSRYVSHLYDQLGELESAYGTWQQLRKEGKVDDAREFAADHRDELRQYRQSENVKQRLSEMNKQIRMIERSDRHPAEKRILINRIRARQSDMAERLN